MSLYQQHLLPHFLHLIHGTKAVQTQRKKLVPKASGHVLEIGFGSGQNLPYYDPERVELLWALEPSAGMRKKAEKNLQNSPIETRWLELPCEQMPLADNSVDSVVLTYTLASIENWEWALEEVRRVLKPGGKLLFCEHGQAPDKLVCWLQKYGNGLWKRLTGGGHLNRPIPEHIEQCGFKIKAIQKGYISAHKLTSYTYCGIAC